MSCINLICSTKKLKLLTGCKDGIKSPLIILKSNVYNDSLQNILDYKKKKLTVINIPKEEQSGISHLLLGSNSRHRKDWFEDFRRMEWTPDGINTWFQHQKKEIESLRQEFIEMRHETLGSDLAAATFILTLGGKAKFKGDDNWMVANEDKTVNLPNKFDPKYVLVALDCSGLDLLYEGLHNFINLTRLKWISFKGNKVFDDWSIDKISAELINLEYLDISECEKVTERGLESLYKLTKLKTLIVTNYNDFESMELSCLMLEECNPQLKCTILSHSNKPTKDENQTHDK